MISAESVFYVVPHADDWQLFMQPNVFLDITTGKKVTIIIVTAGDAGFDQNFWQAREKGCISSIKFCLASRGKCVEQNGTIQIQGHLLNYSKVNNVTAYFIRLPDGNLDGSGFHSNNYQSLYRLFIHQIDTIDNIDKTDNFKSSKEISDLLTAIINFESINTVSCINYLNPDSNINANDHSDHLILGEIIAITYSFNEMHQRLYQGYCTNNFENNLDTEEMFWKIGMFSAYEQTVYNSTGYSTIKESYATYLRWCSTRNTFLSKNTPLFS